MKVTFPLSLKVSLWLLLNLVLLTVAGVGFYWMQFGRGWDSLTAGALGERLQTVADSVMTEVYAASPEDRDAILARRGERTGAHFYLFLNEGRQIGGEAVSLPDRMVEELGRGPTRGGPFREHAGQRAGEDLERPPPPGRGPAAGAGRPPNAGRMVFRTANPRETWIGVRVPLLRDLGPPSPSTLVIRAPSLLALMRVLEVFPWFALAAAAFGLSVLFWLPLVGGITAAVRRLDRATEAIAEGRFETRVAENRRDELGHLGQSVNRMAARLDTLVHGQKRFLGDVAHELGSPLGRLELATEILEHRADPALRAHVQDVREEVQHMAMLVNELLAFTQAGLRPREAQRLPVDVAAVVQDVLAREDPASRVRCALEPGLRVLGDSPLVARALANLVRNAVRYAGNGATVTITAHRDLAHVVIHVDDDGPGVPPEALARLGEPFYRPESARTREGGGAGLGLAIVRSSVTACGGEVHFSNRMPRGFRAALRLDAAPA